MSESQSDKYLIWSNEHAGWWKPGPAPGQGSGYSPALKQAGNFTRDEAIAICKRALPMAMHLGRISEIPVRLADVVDMLQGEIVPGVIFEERNRFTDQ